MANKLILKKSAVASKAPLTTDLEYGEIALNYNDGKLYYKNVDTTIKQLRDGGSLTSASNPPTAAIVGDQWYDTVNQVLYEYINDGTTNYWVDITGPTITTAAVVPEVTLTGTQTLSNKTLTNPTITNYTETLVNLGTVGSAHTFSLTSGTVFVAKLSSDTLCVFTMPTAAAGKSFTLFLKQDDVDGGGTASFTGVKWNVATPPVIGLNGKKLDIYSFISDGTSWYGSFIQNYTY